MIKTFEAYLNKLISEGKTISEFLPAGLDKASASMKQIATYNIFMAYWAWAKPLEWTSEDKNALTDEDLFVECTIQCNMADRYFKNHFSQDVTISEFSLQEHLKTDKEIVADASKWEAIFKKYESMNDKIVVLDESTKTVIERSRPEIIKSVKQFLSHFDNGLFNHLFSVVSKDMHQHKFNVKINRMLGVTLLIFAGLLLFFAISNSVGHMSHTGKFFSYYFSICAGIGGIAGLSKPPPVTLRPLYDKKGQPVVDPVDTLSSSYNLTSYDASYNVKIMKHNAVVDFVSKTTAEQPEADATKKTLQFISKTVIKRHTNDLYVRFVVMPARRVAPV